MVNLNISISNPILVTYQQNGLLSRKNEALKKSVHNILGENDCLPECTSQLSNFDRMPFLTELAYTFGSYTFIFLLACHLKVKQGASQEELMINHLKLPSKNEDNRFLMLSHFLVKSCFEWQGIRKTMEQIKLNLEKLIIIKTSNIVDQLNGKRKTMVQIKLNYDNLSAYICD